MPEARYTVVWFFPSGTFRHIFCWPGYTWFTAAGRWLKNGDRVELKGQSSAFTDDLSDNHRDRPYSHSFTVSPDGQSLISTDSSKDQLVRLSPEQLGALFSLETEQVPTCWQDFHTLMLRIEKQLGITESMG